MKVYESHGHARGRKRTGTQNVWTNMMQRCYNESRPDYRYYGGRGIGVCDCWRDSFNEFLADMGEKPEGKTLDRIDNDKGYEPGNCRWATKDEQMQNTRKTRLIEFLGVTMGLNAWARKLGITHASLQGRLHRGWPVDRALTQPKRHEVRRGN